MIPQSRPDYVKFASQWSATIYQVFQLSDKNIHVYFYVNKKLVTGITNVRV